GIKQEFLRDIFRSWRLYILKITFVLPGLGTSGGKKVVFEYAKLLKERGHDISVIYPVIPMQPGKHWYEHKRIAKTMLGTGLHLGGVFKNYWANLNDNLLMAPSLSEKHVPDADIIIATWWKTADYVSSYSIRKGKKFYFIQHYEIWGGPKEKVEMSYKAGLRNIVISNWLKNILENLGATVNAVIPNGINLDEFYPEKVGRGNKDKIRILMPYRRQSWKGFRDGLSAYEIVAKKYKNTQLVLFGPRPGIREIPKNYEFHLFPMKDDLRMLYCSCDIFLFPSHHEGFGLPPMEAMACGLPVVTTDVGAITDYSIPGKTALVSPPHNPGALAQNMMRLLENEQERRTLAEEGVDYIKNFTWEQSVQTLENIFLKAYGDK
ncbi:MAG TPA: glycosyltransferase family 1 protein, partial [Nitrospirae bacterium]|nr:glycosyltransferase family 1 protein [Nitrospirota bacterium]